MFDSRKKLILNFDSYPKKAKVLLEKIDNYELFKLLNSIEENYLIELLKNEQIVQKLRSYYLNDLISKLTNSNVIELLQNEFILKSINTFDLESSINNVLLEKVITNEIILSNISIESLEKILHSLKDSESSFKIISNNLIYMRIIKESEYPEDIIINIIEKFNDSRKLEILSIKELKDINLFDRLSKKNLIKIICNVYLKEGLKAIPSEFINNLDSFSISKILITVFKDNLEGCSDFLNELNVSYGKLILILNNLTEISEERKIHILYSLYPNKKDDKTIKAKKDELIKIFKDKLKNLNIRHRTEDKYLEKDLIKILVDDKYLFEETTKNLLSDENFYKSFDKMFFQVYFKAFAVNTSKESDFKPSLSYVLNSKNPNYYCISKNLANIDLSDVKENLFRNLDIFDAIFHEVDHSQQHYLIETDEVEYENLKFVKDIILRVLLPNYYSRNENYFVTSIESSARCLAFLQVANLLEKYNEMEYINFINKKRAYYENNLKVRQDILRKFNSKKINLHLLFDLCVPSELIKRFIKTYPILSYEYNTNGKRLSIQELNLKLEEALNLMNMFPEGSEEFEKAKKIVNFYVNYIKDKQVSEETEEFELSRSLFF